MGGGKGKVRGIMKDNLSCDTAGVGRKDGGERRGGRRCEEEAGEKRDNASPLQRKREVFSVVALVCGGVGFFFSPLSLFFFSFQKD